jgi:flagellar assembly protein FliH
MKELQDLLKDKIRNYEFEPLFDDSDSKDGIGTFEFIPLRKDQVMDVQKHERVIKSERLQAQKSGFEIAPIVREHRGINRQQDLERQRLIQEEVEKQLVRIQDQAYKEGFEKGLKDGQEEVFAQTRAEVEQKIESLTEMIGEVLKTQHELLAAEKMAVYRTIRNLTKWVILRELKDDGEYVVRLLEKLMNELQVKSNVLIQIDSKSFEDKPDILEILQEKLGELNNIRVEVDYDIEGPGVVVESENGIINGSLKEQFYNLSRLFESVGLQANEEEGLGEVLESGEIDIAPQEMKSNSESEMDSVETMPEQMNDEDTTVAEITEESSDQVEDSNERDDEENNES